MSTSALHFQKINQTLLLHCLPRTVRPLGRGNQIRFQRRKYLKALCMSLTTPFLFPFACLCCRILYPQSIPLAKDVTWTPERIICKQYSGHFQKKNVQRPLSKKKKVQRQQHISCRSSSILPKLMLLCPAMRLDVSVPRRFHGASRRLPSPHPTV
jgi:hypothetical protein